MYSDLENRHSLIDSIKKTSVGGKHDVDIDIKELIKTGTTIIAIEYKEEDGSTGLILGGDKRASSGNMIFSNRMQKIHRIDSSSYIGISGVVAVGMEFVNILKLELEHYRKIENRDMSARGKANRLSYLIKANLNAAFSGLVAIPLFCSHQDSRSYIFSYDIAGASYEEEKYHSIGSGSVWITALLRDQWRYDIDYKEAVRLMLRSFIYVSEHDSASYGIDIERNIYPDIVRMFKGGVKTLEKTEIADEVRAIYKKSVKNF